jgi:hypothetical protein
MKQLIISTSDEKIIFRKTDYRSHSLYEVRSDGWM